MAWRPRLIWLWRRLGRMSAPEMAYRAWEQVKRLADRLRPAGWSAFGDFPVTVAGLPGLAPSAADAQVRNILTAEAQAILDGRFAFLGQPWPDRKPGGQDWWRGDLWRLDPVSGRTWPGAERFAFDVPYRAAGALGDVKFVWEINRLQMLPPLALHLALEGDTHGGAVVFDILQGWMDANPPCRGVNWTSGVEAASRVVSLLAALAFVSPAAAQRALVRTFLHAHVRWIARYPSRFSSANNHRIAELTALFLAFLCAPGLPHADRRRRAAQAGLEREMERQVHPDGVGAEQSTAYAAYSLEWFTLAGLAGEAAGQPFSPAFKARARLALDHLRWLLDEEGRIPRIGDDDHSRVLALTQAPEPRYGASVAAMAARWLKTAGPPASIRDRALRDLLGEPTTEGAALTGVRTFAKGGMTVWRRPRPDGAWLLAFDHGPLGHGALAAHGHADALSIWLHWGGEAVFVGAGTHLYHADAGARAALRATDAHNTLTLAGESQSRMVGPFAWADHARVRLVRATAEAVEAEHDGYRRWFGLRHRRRVMVDDDQVLIEDWLDGRTRTPRLPWSLGFTLAPEISAVVDGPRADLRLASGRHLRVTSETVGATAAAWDLVETAYAPGFGRLGVTRRLGLSGLVGAQPLIARTRIALLPS